MDASVSPPPRVSIIIATYRPGDYLRQALASVRAQTFGDFEVLVADDGRDEETRRIVAEFADPRFVYSANPTTLGAAANHWAAMRRARGEFLTILNHDDLWQPDFLRRMVAGLSDPAVVVAFCDHDVIDSQGRTLAEETTGLSHRTGRAALAAGTHRPFRDLSAHCVVPAAQAAVMRRSVLDLDGLPPEAGPAYDLWLNFLLARGGGGAFYAPERLASWRTHAASISVAPARSDWPAGAGACFAAMAADPGYAALRRFLTRRAADGFAAAALASLRGGRRAEARVHARRALRQRPWHVRALAAFGLSLLPRSLGERLIPPHA